MVNIDILLVLYRFLVRFQKYQMGHFAPKLTQIGPLNDPNLLLILQKAEHHNNLSLRP
jgi:hypothetical protein